MGEGVVDRWAAWLLERRFGGDRATAEPMMAELRLIRDRVLDGAALREGDRLLDVGAGDGLVAFGALERFRSVEVVFSDVSDDLLERCRSLAADMGVLDRCTFVRAGADELAGIEDASVDAVTTRSVLIYVRAKERALQRFWRVLRPGGHISLGEPINAYFPFNWLTYEDAGIEELASRVQAAWAGDRPAADDPILDFTEHDLVAFAERAGFSPIRLTLEVRVEPAEPKSWQAYFNSAPNPLASTLREVVERALTPEEAGRYVAHRQPQVERGAGTRRLAFAYLTATRP